MSQLPEDPNIPASHRDIMVAGIVSLLLGSFLIWASHWFIAQLRSIEQLTSFPFLFLVTITGLPGFALVVIAFTLLRPKKKRAPQLMGSTVLYIVGGFLILIPISLLLFMNSAILAEMNGRAWASLSMFLGLGFLAFRLARTRSKSNSSAPMMSAALANNLNRSA